MIGRHSFASASLTVIAVLWFASPAAAQTVADETPQTPSWAGSDIVVTGQRQTYAEPETTAATRTATLLIQVPQSVQVLTRTLIQEQDRRTLGDALVNVSGGAFQHARVGWSVHTDLHVVVAPSQCRRRCAFTHRCRAQSPV